MTHRGSVRNIIAAALVLLSIGVAAFGEKLFSENILVKGKVRTYGLIEAKGTAVPDVSPTGFCRIYYRASDNKLYLSRNGGAYAELTAAGDTIAAMAAGAVGAPGLGFTGDTDTGFYRVGANSLGVAAAGSGVATFDATGLNLLAGILDIPSGSAAAPSLTFSGDTNLGVYRVGADSLGVTAAGAQVATFSAAGIVLAAGVASIPAGTALLPSLTFTGDLNTGIYQVAANNVGISCNGGKILDVGTGGVAVTGTLSADGVTDLAAGAVGAPGLTVTGDPDTGLYQIGANNLGIACSGAKVLDIGTAGVGVTGTLSTTGVTSLYAGAVTTPTLTITGDANTGLYQIGADNLGVACNGAKVLDVGTAGLGVTGTLGVTGVTDLAVGAVATPGLTFTGDANSGLYWIGADNLGVAANGAKVLDIATTGLDVTGALTATTSITAGVNGAAGSAGSLVVRDGANPGTSSTITYAKSAALDASPIGTPTMVVGVEGGGGTTINVTVQLTDYAGADLAVRGSVFAYLSDDANGDSIATAAPSGGWAIGTDGLLIPVVAGKAAHLTSEADGDIDITLTEAGAATWYLILVLPNGKLVPSGAITFAP